MVKIVHIETQMTTCRDYAHTHALLKLFSPLAECIFTAQLDSVYFYTVKCIMHHHHRANSGTLELSVSVRHRPLFDFIDTCILALYEEAFGLLY